jgi:glyceraldehyde-3-phosphate dehydrogenase (NAD(P))
MYDRFDRLVTIVQGGEKHEFTGTSFNAFTNYEEACGKRHVRVISCSSTGITRLVYALDRTFGVRQAFAALARRAADPAKPGKNPHNALTPTLGWSHHGADVNCVLARPRVLSMSVDCPTTFGHVINLQADLDRPSTNDDILAALDSFPRIIVGSGLRNTAELAEHYQDLGRSRRDRPEIYVWQEGLQVERTTVYATMSVHMESITIPETVDCVRATLGTEQNKWASIYRTDCALGIAKPPECYQRQVPHRRSDHLLP